MKLLKYCFTNLLTKFITQVPASLYIQQSVLSLVLMLGWGWYITTPEFTWEALTTFSTVEKPPAPEVIVYPNPNYKP